MAGDAHPYNLSEFLNFTNVRYGCPGERFVAGKQPGNTGSGNHAGGESDDCDITIDCDLSGIHPGTLASVRKGDQLHLRIELGDPYRSVVCVTIEGAILGALTAFPGYSKLIRCLERDVAFAVTVQDVGAGRCHVVGGVVS